MQLLPPEYFLDLYRREHEERVRGAGMHRLAAAAQTSSPARRVVGASLVRLGLLVGGPALGRSPDLVPAHRGGPAR